MKKYIEDFEDWCFRRPTPNFLFPLFVIFVLPIIVLAILKPDTTHLVHQPTGLTVIKGETDSNHSRLGLQKVLYFDKTRGDIVAFYVSPKEIITVSNNDEEDRKLYEALKRRFQ